MTEYADFGALVNASDLHEEDLTLKNGMRVKIKGFSRYEYMLALKNAEGDPGLIERRIIKFGMVEPRLTIEQVEQWVSSSPSGVIEDVSEGIRRLSRMGEDADKSDVSGV